MFRPLTLKLHFLVLGMLALGSNAQAQAPQVSGFTPNRYTLNNAPNTTISVQFNVPGISSGSVSNQSFLVYGERSGYHSGNYSYSTVTRTVVFTPDSPFIAGERVTVLLTTGIQGPLGTPMAAPFSWQFFIRTSVASGKFELDTTYSTNKRPNYIAVADVNKDGRLDLGVVNSNDNDVFTFLNTSSGRFDAGVKTAVGDLPRAATFGDFDRDGDMDMAVVNETAANISILRNDGSGSFSSQGTLNAGNKPVFATQGDLDGDGFLDLIVVNQTDNQIGVYTNSGTGTFGSATTYNAGNGPEMAYVSDFNNDGRLDVAVTSGNNSVIVVLLNNGSGGLGSSSTYATDLGPRGLIGQDFNGDGFVDLATSNRDGNSVSILRNNGSGGFDSPQNVAVGLNSFSISSIDFDGDNFPDLTACNQDANNFHILMNDGAGTFAVDSVYSAGGSPRALNTGDFNGDGLMDVVVSNRTDDNFQVFLNTAAPSSNNAPGTPVLNTPAAGSHLNPGSAAIALNWSVPIDLDADPLHFLVEIASNSSFSNIVVSADSRSNTTGFSPVPPVAQNIMSVTYTVSTNLANGNYWWRVKAHDGTVFGAESAARKFKVDATNPVVDSVTLTNPAPTFAPNWYNRNTVSAVDIVAQYDEANADRAVFNLGSLGGSQTVSDIASGTDQTAQLTINLNGASDGTFPLTATVIDSAGNQAVSNNSIALDGTPPTGTLAVSPPKSQNETFAVSWGNGSDGTGSGLSGKFDVRMRVNGGAWSNWLTNFEGTTSNFTGTTGNVYGFEAVAYDNVGNLEAFTNTAETTTEIDTTNDVDAPAAPLNLVAGGASPSPWQNTATFTITFQNPPDASGIATILYKLGGAPPTANSDATGSVAATTSFNLDATEQNGQNLYVWLRDNSGNENFANNAVVNLRYDATPPTGTTASSPSLSSDLAFTVSWAGTGTDGAGSGLNGKYDIRVRDGNGAFTNLQTDFEATSLQFTGLQGHTYSFEVAAKDVAGNTEVFAGNAESTTEVDTTSRDDVAPGPPTQLTAGGSNPSPWQRVPQFIVTWQAPQDPSGIQAAYYKVGETPVSNFDTTASVKSGSSVTITAGAQDGLNFYIWFQDQRGNIDFRNAGQVPLRYDATAPRIYDMDFDNGDYFPSNGMQPVAWYNQADTPELQLITEYDELHANTITLSSPELDTTISEEAESGLDISKTYVLDIQDRQDGVYELKLAIADSANNVTRDSTKFGLDTTPPSGATATSPDTSKLETFTVSWSAGTDAGSGVSGRFTVRFRENEGDWQSWLTNFEGTSSQFEGEHGVTYAFEAVTFDNVGNRETIREVDETTTVVDTGFADTVMPTITHSALTIVDQGRDTTIVARIQDNSQVVEALFFYKPTNATTYQSVPMVTTGPDTFKAAIIAQQLGTIGINYYIRASDGINQAFFPSGAPSQPLTMGVRILGTDNQGLAKTSAQPSGSKAFAYRMISVPLDLTSRDALDVLSDDLGDYDSKTWRLFQFQTTSATYNEYPRIGDFKPGSAMWLIVNEPNKIIDSGIGTTVSVSTPFEITLSEGWNDIGIPFTFSISKNNVQVISGNTDDVLGPYTFQEGWLLPNQVQALQPWEGYSFYCRSDGVRIAIYPTTPTTQAAKTLAFDAAGEMEPDWFIGIEARGGELSDLGSRVGVAEGALEDWDRLDYLQPPFISDFVTVRMQRPEWTRLSGTFKSDFRPENGEGHVWQFEVATSLAGESIALQFNNLATLPAGYRAVLLDRETYKQVDLSNRDNYTFTPDQDSKTRQFELIVGTEAFVSGSDHLSNPIPERFSLGQNYPNPFNAGTTMLYEIAQPSEVTVKVVNILGQEVRQLVNDTKVAGVYRLHWDGKGDNGLELSTGVYFIRLQAGKFQQIRKVLFVR